MNTLSLFQPIRAFVFDVDGVLTDGTLLLLPAGEMARSMNIKDGYAMQLAVKRGYHVVIISGGTSALVEERLRKLGIIHVFMTVHDKLAVLRNFMEAHHLQPEQVLYMGDDLPDFEVMQLAGLPCSPNDACIEIKNISKYVSACSGGTGCARDVIEKTLRLNGDWVHVSTVSSR